MESKYSDVKPLFIGEKDNNNKLDGGDLLYLLFWIHVFKKIFTYFYLSIRYGANKPCLED